jgi:hypothetical protein
MTTNQPFENYADAYNTMHEMGASINANLFSYRLCISLRMRTISMDDFEILSKSLVYFLEKAYIETPIEY